MPDVTAGYGRIYDINTFVWEFSTIITCLKPYITLSNFGKWSIKTEVKR